ncbi:MAG: type III pantothenate kinase [Alphaproteobacteria bacterium]|nr:type III pantothenate kinase [Alphaproteobacteria bacterium]
MLLAIAADNTNTKFALFDGGTVRAQWRAATNAQKTADEYAVWLIQLFNLNDLKPASVDAVIISTVVPAALFNLKLLAERYFKTKPMVVGEGLDLGVPVRVDFPGEVGADRLVNTVAAHLRHGGPAIVVDFGTATSFDVVAKDGAFEGGVIAPGINLSIEALHMATAKLPRISIARPATVIGKSTVPCIQSGVFWGYVSLIEGLVARIKAEMGGGKIKVIATGGLAPLFAGSTAVFDTVDADLNFDGLHEIWRRNARA